MTGENRVIGFWGLTLSCITCIIGSGWLLGSLNVAAIAGPAGIFSWILGGALVMLIAVTACEAGTFFSLSGSTARLMEFSHGSLAGYINAWANWLGIIVVVPAEAEASVSYMMEWGPGWKQALLAEEGGFSGLGLLAAAIFIFVYFIVNYYSVKFLIRFLSALTVFKILLPVATAVVLIWVGMHPENFTVDEGTLFSNGSSAMLISIATGGIIMAFNGFQTPLNLAGEAKKPGLYIPVAVLGSIAFCAVLYTALQVAFIGAVPTADIQGGWSHESLKALASAPIVQLAIAFNLHFLVICLQIDAVVSPSGTGIAYMTTSSRMLYAMEENGYMPKAFGFIRPGGTIPIHALSANFVIALLFLLIFRTWDHLVAIISILHILSYLTFPITTMALRRLLPDVHGPIRIPGMRFYAPVAFILTTLLLYWASWPLTGEVNLIIVVGFAPYIYYQSKRGWPEFRKQFRAAVWLITYLIVMTLFSWLGSESFGGNNVIPGAFNVLLRDVSGITLPSSAIEHVLLVLMAWGFYVWGVRSAWLTEPLKRFVQSHEDARHTIEPPDEL